MQSTPPPDPTQAQPCRACLAGLALAAATGFMLSLVPLEALAAMYKCRDTQGRVTYADHPCASDAQAWAPKRRLNTVGAETLTGRKAEPKDNRPEWLRPIDPIGDCKKRGGRIDRALRACIVP